MDELGIDQISQYALYQFGMKTGHYRRTLQAIATSQIHSGKFEPIFKPARADMLDKLLQDTDFSEAQLILAGQYRPYGGEIQTFDFSIPSSDIDWTLWHFPLQEKDSDIKDIWEPARFVWAVTLARAYRSTGDNRYAEKFWEYFTIFNRLNPPYRGPNWMSAQEAALRLIHMCICAGEIWTAPSSTPDRKQALAESMALHAERIPVTLVYARAQGNNHLLSEAAGLFTAGQCLPDHPHASRWCELGWSEFESGIMAQVAEDGTYAQHSACYHRLMLTLALWMNVIRGNRSLSAQVLERLWEATNWLDELTRGLNGQAPNLGSNDGSLIIPLSNSEVTGYLDVVTASKTAFCGEQFDPTHEYSAWLARSETTDSIAPHRYPIHSFQRLDGEHTVGFLCTAKFTSRPSHADLLHFDLWWHGYNILRDAGTYRYNAPEPWGNQLAGSDVHNLVTVDGQDQMTRAGKFLWQDWAQVQIIKADQAGEEYPHRISARMDGYRKLDLSYERTVELLDHDRWLISDHLDTSGSRKQKHTFRLHWLLPDVQPLPFGEDIRTHNSDWVCQMDQNQFTLRSPLGLVSIKVKTSPIQAAPEFCLYRKGEIVYGNQSTRPTWGWYSPTYGVKEPALALAVYLTAEAPVTFVTSIQFIPWETKSDGEGN